MKTRRTGIEWGLVLLSAWGWWASGAAVRAQSSFAPPPIPVPTTPASDQQTSAFAPSPAKLVEGGQIVARIDDQVILASDVLWQVNLILEENRDSIPPGQEEQIRTVVLRRKVMELIDTKLLYADFRRTVPPENLPKVEENLHAPFEEKEIPRLLKMLDVSDRLELTDQLRKHGSSIANQRQAFIERAIAGEWLRNRLPKPKPVTHEQMLEYYNAHLQEYDYPAEIRWEELMVKFDRFDNQSEAWRKLAEMGNQVWQQATRNPEIRGPVFAEVAKAQSHGFTAKDGGLHAWTTQNSLRCQALNDALISLELGQLSNIIESDLAFHIVRILERKEAGRTSFVDAQADIRKELISGQRNGMVAKELHKIRKASFVWTLFDGNLSAEQLAMALGGRKK